MADATMSNGTAAALALPKAVRISPGTMFTPNELRRLKVISGHPLGELLDEENLDLLPERLQASVWIALRREGYDVTWEQAGDVLPEMTQETEQPDPTMPAPSSSSSASAASGG
jgi:hypothetical protein